MSARVRIACDGDVTECTVVEFFAANETLTAGDVHALDRDGRLVIGGGAAPLVIVTLLKCPGRDHRDHAEVTCNGTCCTACGGPIDENEECRC